MSLVILADGENLNDLDLGGTWTYAVHPMVLRGSILGLVPWNISYGVLVDSEVGERFLRMLAFFTISAQYLLGNLEERRRAVDLSCKVLLRRSAAPLVDGLPGTVKFRVIPFCLHQFLNLVHMYSDPLSQKMVPICSE